MRFADASKFFVLLLPLLRLSYAANETNLRAALDEHRWFDLRDSVISGQAPTVYRFFVAAAFNEVRGAEKELSAAIRSGADRGRLAAMHYAMNRLYLRVGQYHKAVRELRLCWAQPDTAPPDAVAKEDVAAVDSLPDQKVASRGAATLRYTNWPQMSVLVALMVINGQGAQFVLDTDAGMSVTSEAEAKRLGLRMLSGQALFDGITGKRTTNAHYAVADRLRIGNTELRDVAFTVLSDDLDAWAEVPVSQRGVVGLPVLLAVETIQWNRNHELRIGFPPGHADLRNANLSFEELDPLALVEIAGHKLAVDLDTGSTISTMWPLFAKNFPELLEGSHESKTGMLGATGSADIRSAIVPEVRLILGGLPIVFRNAPTLLTSTILVSTWQYGQIGIDQLAQASDVTIDFKALKIQLK
ncbi:MAG: retropepsin-like aspartic protease [Bryobacteraceae bacterium]